MQAASFTWQQLRIEYRAVQEGYAQVLVANESEKAAWFDDISVKHEPALIVQENHYDPWGLNLVGIETQGNPDHRFQYNGKEKQEELGLQWTDFGQRMQDPQLGRFFAIDRFANSFSSLSPYNYTANNPTNLLDYNGDYIILFTENNAYSVLYENGQAYHYTQDKKTGKITKGEKYDGNSKFVGQAVSDLAKIQNTKKGASVIGSLQESSWSYRIEQADRVDKGAYEADFSKNTLSFEVGGGTIRYSPFSRWKADGVYWDPSNSEVQLAHEIRHAWLHEKTGVAYTKGWTERLLKESDAVRFENYFRALRGEEEMRTLYGSNDQVLTETSPEYYLDRPIEKKDATNIQLKTPIYQKTDSRTKKFSDK